MTITSEADMDPMILDWCYAREAIRRLGFPAEDIYFAVNSSGNVLDASSGVATSLGGPVIALVLRSQGREWIWTIGATKLATKDIEPAYHAACEFWNARPADPGWDARFKASRIFAQRHGLLASLRSKGFALPGSPRR